MTDTTTEWHDLTNVEGLALIGGTGKARILQTGQEGILYEIAYPAGVRSPEHAHTHDSYIYLLEGRLVGTRDGRDIQLLPGQSTLHPTGVSHSVHAVTDSRWLEFKAPAQAGWR